jgi:HK97 gp10 family phage protein
MSIRGKVDLSGMGLDKLGGDVRLQLASSMLVAGGRVVRDEARVRAPVDTGLLKQSIYVARDEKASVGRTVAYNVSWNKRTAPHGHLLEFGHWRVNRLVPTGELGRWKATTERLPAPVWTPAEPFLRPAWEATKGRLLDVMVARGRVRLPELINGAAADSAGDIA